MAKAKVKDEPQTVDAANDAWNALSGEERAEGVAECAESGHADPLFREDGVPFCPRCATFLG